MYGGGRGEWPKVSLREVKRGRGKQTAVTAPGTYSAFERMQLPRQPCCEAKMPDETLDRREPDTLAPAESKKALA